MDTSSAQRATDARQGCSWHKACGVARQQERWFGSNRWLQHAEKGRYSKATTFACCYWLGLGAALSTGHATLRESELQSQNKSAAN